VSSERVSEEIPAPLAGERLDRIVSLIAEISRSDAAETVSRGGVSVDGVVERSGKIRIGEGRVVEVDLGSIPRDEPPAADESVSISVVHEDDDVIVVDKAPGVVVHPGAGNTSGTLVNGLLARFPEIAEVGDPLRPGIVHRLDVGTSGLLVVARSSKAYDALVAALSEHEVSRHYTALVWGHLDAPSGTIDAAIGRDPRDPLKMAVVASGKTARTHYSVEREFSEPEVSLLACELDTGRTHQIRVHLSAIGHPVVGDITYGGQRAGLSMERPFLHAGRLSFVHPVSFEVMDFASPLPADLRSVLARCR
jgi:23S rRNA pseudouridine1911/1915/1917 synthase